MARKAPIVTLDFLKGKLTPFLEDDDFFWDFNEKFEKDLQKVEFDFENTEYEGQCFSTYPIGYQVLPNGLPVLFVNAGGDWEYPICFVVYWDGKSIRGYIPEDGNVYNKKLKSAYGNNEDDDPSEVPDTDKIIADIVKRIEIK